MVDSAVNIIPRSYQLASGKADAVLNNTDAASFSKELNDILSERSSEGGSFPIDDADLSKLAPCGREVNEASEDASQDEETEEAGDDIIFDWFEHCFECEERENCAHYLGMTGASEEEIEKADIIVKSPFDKYNDMVHGQLSRALRTSILYNYNLICPEIDKKTKRDK